MGILSKGLTKLLKPEVGPLGGPSKKVRNPIVKPRVDTTKTVTRDINFDIEDRESIDKIYGDVGGYRDTKGKDCVIPKKIGEFYSPVKDTIEQMPIAKEGSTGQTIEAFLNKRSPSVTKSELANARIKLDPNKKYLREEVLALENIPDAYDIRVRSMKDGNVLFDRDQRQPVLDRPDDYFEVTIHTPKIDPDVEQVTSGHFPTGTVAHIRASRRKGEDGEDYILIEEVQSDAARAAGEKYEDTDYARPQESAEFEEAFGASISTDFIFDVDEVEDIGKQAKIEWMNDDYEKAISEAIDDYNTDFGLGNPFLFTGGTFQSFAGVRGFYRDVHQRLNDPNLYDVQMEKPEDVAYLKAQDEALRLDIQGEDIPAAYNKPYREKAEDLIESYKMNFPSLKKDTRFNIYSFLDRKTATQDNIIADSEELKLVPDAIRKIHAYAIKKDGQDFINNRLPERAAAELKAATGKDDALEEKLKDGTVQKYLLEDSPDPFLKSESIEKIIKNVEDSLDTKILPEDRLGKNEIFAKEQVPITTKTETMLKGLQASIVLAKKQGLDKIIIPSYRQFDKTRGYGEPSGDESVFKDLYDQAFKKAFNILKTDSKGTLKLGSKKIKIAKDDYEPSSYVNDMPHYGGADFYEDFAYEIDISNFEFDPDKQAFRFSKGGTLMDDQMELFNEGGLRDEGGQVEPESGNKVPSGSLKEEVADDIPVMMSEGEFVFPADVVRFIGLNTLMKMRQDAKQGLKMMEDMGQMGNSEEATIPDDIPFEMADLIVVSGDAPKKMQGGGLLDDPRFQRPEGGGGTPTITDEDKKQMEDALLRTGYGNVVMKRYVNADGDVKYIPFVDGEPQMEIPEGYELDESAPKTQTNIGGGYTDSGGGDSGGPTSPAPAIGDGITFEKPKLMVDGKEFQSIDEMDTETLVKYYEQFNSPIYRYAATGAALFFSPIVGLAISLGQSYSNKNSPNGLNAVQQKLMTMNLTKEQRDRVNGVYNDIKKRGAGGISSFGKTIFNALGLTSDKEKNEKETAFEKFLRTGNVKGAIGAGKDAIGASSKNKKAFDNAAIEGFQNIIQPQGAFQNIIDRPQQGFQNIIQPQGAFQNIIDPAIGDMQGPPMATDQPVTQTAPTDMGMDEEQNYKQNLSALVDPRAKVKQEERAKVDYDVPLSIVPPVDETFKEDKVDLYAPAIDSPDSIIPPVDEDYTEESIRRLKKPSEGVQDLLSIQKDLRALEAKNKREADTLRKKLASMGTDYGQQRVQQDDDRDDGGSSNVDDFFGGDFGQPSQPTFTPTTTPVYTSQTAGGQQRPQTFGVPSTPSIGTGGGGRGQRFGPTGGFYVGGVPTKPMKPQRLKKGGLAKPKVKPKRMKKGGLASRKK